MKLNFQKIFGIIAIFLSLNLVLSSVAPLIVLASEDIAPLSFPTVKEEEKKVEETHEVKTEETPASFPEVKEETKDKPKTEIKSAAREIPLSFPTDEIPVSFPTDEPPVSFPEEPRQEVRLDILLDSLHYTDGYVCGLAELIANKLEVTIQHWYSDYTLQGRWFTEDGEFSDWTNLVGQPNSQFTTHENDATYVLNFVTDTPEGEAGWEIRVLNDGGENVGNNASVNYLVTQDAKDEACGGTPLRYTISGQKFEDTNENSLPDIESDDALEGWTIRLYDASWTLLDEMVTDENGDYSFADLKSGTYYTCEVNQSNWSEVFPSVESGIENDSGDESEANYCNEITIPHNAESSTVNNVDFANIEVSVDPHNLIPEVVIIASPGSTVTKPKNITLVAVGIGGDGVLTYSWTCNTGESSNVPGITLKTVGTHNCIVQVTDEDGDSSVAAGKFIIKKAVETPTPTQTEQPTGNGVTVTTDNSSPDTPSIDEGESTTDPTTPTDVKGLDAQTCDTKSNVSGRIFFDTNPNNTKDDNEENISDVSVSFLAIQKDEDGNIVDVGFRTLKSNTLGEWTTSLCPGTYKIRLTTEDLPEGSLLGGDNTFQFTVEEGKELRNVNFAVYKVDININTNWWIFLLPLVLLVLAAGGYAIYSTNQKKKGE